MMPALLTIARCAGLLMLAVLTSISGISTTSASERVIVVFDASGSMWGQISGTSKINITRQALEPSINDWKNLDLEVGLIVYGHRRKGDCTDIETMIPSGPINAQSFSGIIDRIQPRGKTPLAVAVRKAAEELRYTEEKATFILLSDGLETRFRCAPSTPGSYEIRYLNGSETKVMGKRTLRVVRPGAAD